MTNPYDPTYTPSYATVPHGPADDDHLKVLSICHFVWAGLCGFFGLFPCIHIVMGILLLNGKLSDPGRPPVPDEAVIGWMFVIMGSAFVLCAETVAVLTLLSGFSIIKRRRRTLVLITAGLNCIFMPIGTVLGIFTLIVMLRPS